MTVIAISGEDVTNKLAPILKRGSIYVFVVEDDLINMLDSNVIKTTYIGQSRFDGRYIFEWHIKHNPYMSVLFENVTLISGETSNEDLHLSDVRIEDKAILEGFLDNKNSTKSKRRVPSKSTIMRIFKMFDNYGLLRDDLSFDPEHFIETTIIPHFNDDKI